MLSTFKEIHTKYPKTSCYHRPSPACDHEFCKNTPVNITTKVYGHTHASRSRIINTASPDKIVAMALHSQRAERAHLLNIDCIHKKPATLASGGFLNNLANDLNVDRNINTRWKVELLELVHCGCCRFEDVDQALVCADFELVHRLFVNVRRTVHCELADVSRKRHRAGNACA